MRLVLVGAAAAALAFGSDIKGTYVEARTADVFTGPCFANAEVNLVGDEAVLGWKIEKGEYNGVDISGLSIVAAVKASGTLGDVHTTAYPVKSVLILDERATKEQQQALMAFARKMSGDLLQDVVRTEVRPISVEFQNNNVHSMRAKMTAGELARVETRPINDKDHLCTNEEVWYSPLTKVEHAMAGVATQHDSKVDGLGSKWSSPDKRSAFVGTFSLEDKTASD